MGDSTAEMRLLVWPLDPYATMTPAYICRSSRLVAVKVQGVEVLGARDMPCVRKVFWG